ncbi:putative DNA binding domain-containing protein [Vibrio sp. MM46]|uniref:RNA-binding domain-containing protein n=1 Tax=Vibrio sp. MM46 TaxID=2998835 RepID=UPI0022CD66D6|nr:RNA-binding domain-containing protein [Vibrio sp. MM46]MDA0121391.1 putative DNA binding domain-containing protein [Vibrio sp. MM46]
MKIVELQEDEALYYCTKDEDHFFDRKAFGLKGNKLQKIAVAFANADGGEVVIGIADEKHEPTPEKRWQGRETTEEFNSLIQALSELIPSVDFRFDFLTRVNESRNYVLRLKINKGLAVHETADKKIYVRVGAQSQPVTAPVKILELTHAKGIKSEEDSLIHECRIEELDESSELQRFLSGLPLRAPEPISFLTKEKLITPEWVPTVASILLFHENPSVALPKQCAIKVVRYDTADDDIDRDALTDDNASIEGALYQQINDAYDVISEFLTKNKVWKIEGLVETKYPKETIWEILVNTVLHRDYSISDHVHVSIFNNRIEFKSPGRFAGFVTADNILENRFSRNSKLVRILSKYKDSPNKDLGEGINTAFQRMKELGLKEPEIIEDGNYVKIILRHSLNQEPEKLILQFLEKHGEISNRQTRDLLGIDSSEKVTYQFGRLRDKKLIKRKDSSTGVHVRWILAEPNQE